MKHYEIEYSTDGCPNNCLYCQNHDIPCVYTDEGGKYTCSLCKKSICGSNVYSYKDFDFCEECFDEGKEKVSYKIEQANENINARSISIGGSASMIESALKQSVDFRNAFEVAGKESGFEKDLRDGRL